jgi:hypothetical protein
MKRKTYITAAIVTATSLALALPAAAQTAAPAPRGIAPFDITRFDTDGDGKVTAQELTAAHAAEVTGLDANGDGLIDLAELVARATVNAEARARAQIAALDVDGDGMLSAAELLAHRSGRSVNPEALIRRLDTDGDGAISAAEAEAARGKIGTRQNPRFERSGRGARGGQMHGERRGNDRDSRGRAPFNWRH